MKHSGKATRAALRILFWTLVLLLALILGAVVARFVGNVILAFALAPVALWLLFAAFTLYFFRDPDAVPPADPKAIVSPAHGTVDVIGETTEPQFMGGRCQRISIFLSVIDVHVQKAPLTGKVLLLKHTPGQFLSATKSDCAEHNENVLVGLEPAGHPSQKIALRLIAGLIARRILPWIEIGETIQRGERISLIQFGSRVNVYLPLNAKISVKLGDRVVGGNSILAELV